MIGKILDEIFYTFCGVAVGAVIIIIASACIITLVAILI